MMSQARELRAGRTLADPRWAAVLSRDSGADGRFVYSVSTTGIFCRPSCGARTARPENVDFHENAAAAIAAGFRPCKRCRPDQPPLFRQHAEMVADLCRMIDAADSPPKLAELADHAGLSASHLLRVFKSVTGLTPAGYAAGRRAQRVQARLRACSNVAEALFDAGFNASSRFYENADALIGMTPTAFRAGGVDTEIRFAIGECALGAILVAASRRGVCAILMGDDAAVLARDLQDLFPQAELIGDDPGFDRLVARVIAFVEAPRLGLDLPLDVRGTAFQQRVWQTLREIPAGTTLSYAELAERVGTPRGARAVAGACAANVLAVAIPCHRIVRTDGSLSGYRWGVERKRTLLAREAAGE
ncbi:bifunctional DNA-binding transcriptional regulator/O6-methylguanine-DNA methyltransferase Ada [Parazoarcus communis]|nr:bifunctional DNA-binding transcriptional regulator/O6-methylguanine-DNA methyltransferase Ada [Parazoarcus communis]